MKSDVRIVAWYDYPDRVQRLCEFLVEVHGYSAKDLLGVLAKPWHWTADYNEMVAMESHPTRREIDERNADDLLSSGYRRRGGCHEAI